MVAINKRNVAEESSLRSFQTQFRKKEGNVDRLAAKHRWVGVGTPRDYQEDNRTEGEAAWKRDKKKREGVNVYQERAEV